MKLSVTERQELSPHVAKSECRIFEWNFSQTENERGKEKEGLYTGITW
jgi:hypothetical protein